MARDLRLGLNLSRVKPFVCINQWAGPSGRYWESDLLRCAVGRRTVPEQLIDQYELVLLGCGVGVHVRYDRQRRLKRIAADY